MNIGALGGLARVAGRTIEGYGVDRSRRAAAVVAQQKEARESERDRLLNALTGAQTQRLLNPPAEPVEYSPAKFTHAGRPVQGFTDKGGNYYGADRVKLTGDIAPYEEPKPAPNLSFLTVTPAEGQPPVIVGVNPKTGAKVSEVGLAKASDAGGVEKEKRSRALSDLQTALTSFEQTLTTTGSTILPGTDKSVLETAYNDALLKAKEAYNLGVLNGPDYMLMQKVLGDPTSVRNRVLSGGSADEQTKRTVAQISEMRKKFAEQQATLGGGSATQSSGSEAQQLWDAAVKLHGEAKVLQQFGPRPMQ